MSPKALLGKFASVIPTLKDEESGDMRVIY